MQSRTTVNWLFIDLWCYLFIASFDWKIGVFQQTVEQTVVRVYYIFNIYICHMFYDINSYDIASYADGNIPYIRSSNLDAVIN